MSEYILLFARLFVPLHPMNKFVFLLLSFIVVSLHQMGATTTTIWQGYERIDGKEGLSISLDASYFSNMRVADILRLSFVYTGQADYPQISLRNGMWKDLAATAGTAIKEDMTQMDYYANQIMLDDLQQNGLIITGFGYVLTAVDLIEGQGEAGYENAVWIGHTVFPSDKSVTQQLPVTCFGNAALGKVLRLCHQDLRPGAEAILRTPNWNELPGMDKYAQLVGNHTDIVITDEMLEELTKNGCFVQGIAFTLTSVELINEEDLSQLQADVPVVNDWIWFAPDEPNFRVNVTNPTTRTIDFDIVLRIADDKMTFYHDYPFPETLAAGESKDFEYSPAEAWKPGFYHATVMVDGEAIRSFIFGYDVTNMVSAPDMQNDFLDYWNTAKAELSQIEGQYTLTEVEDKSTSKRKVYLLEMKSVPDGTGEGIVRAYYAEPTAAGTYPAVLHFCAYDGGGGLWIPRGDDNPSQIDVVVSTRGQSINNRPPYTNNYGDWFSYGLGDKDTWYYRGAYMDCVRALDFLTTREKVQSQNIFAEGASQGGAFAIACAAFGDGRINAIAPALPFLGDLPYYLQLVVWADNVVKGRQRQLGMSDAEMCTMLSYFDTKNLATLVTCPVIMDFSLQDSSCPPHTTWAAFNNMGSSEKQYLINPTLGHEIGGSWVTELYNFFASHLKSDFNGIQNVPVARQTDASVYDLHGVRYNGSLSSLPHGVYIQQGRKIVK